MLIEFTIPGDPIGAPRMTQRDKWKSYNKTLTIDSGLRAKIASKELCNEC
jgi:hypothetical protein